MFAVARLMPDGTLDSGFGTGGITLIDIAPYSGQQPFSLVVDGDKIVVAGTTQSPVIMEAMFAMRLMPNGQPDSTFGQAGVKVIQSGASEDYGEANAVEVKDGSVLVAGYHWGLAGHGIRLARLDANGALVPGFGSGGLADIAVPMTIDASAFAVAGDSGKWVVGGAAWVAASGTDFLVARVGAEGAPDTFFAEQGFRRLNVAGPGDAKLHSLTVRDNRIVGVGTVPQGAVAIRLIAESCAGFDDVAGSSPFAATSNGW